MLTDPKLYSLSFLVRGGQIPHITQIAAIEPGSKSTFDSYIIPTIPISPEAQQITGIVKTGPTTMAVHGQPVQLLQITSALEKFVT